MDIRLIPMLALLYLLSFLDRESRPENTPDSTANVRTQVAILAMPTLKVSQRT